PALRAGCVRHPGVTLAQSPVRPPDDPPARAPSGTESAAPSTPARPSCAASLRKGGGLIDATGGMADRDERRLPLLSHLPATYPPRPPHTAFGLRSRPEIQR